jgi:glycosyltransferase involved in cell wall biosynthesis
MSELINSFDIILGQFAIGSLGVSELESMACGKPVVSYVDQAMYSQWYGDPPPVLSAREVDAVTESVISLIERKILREEMGKQGREWVLRHHHYLEVASQALSQYRMFLERE